MPSKGLDDRQDPASRELFLAAQQGDIPTLRALCQDGVDVNAATADGVTPLLVASQAGHLEAAQLLRDAGAEQRQALDGGSPLLVAAFQGHPDVVRFLLEAGADKDQQRKNGATPLYLAAMKGHLEVVKILCDAGADKDRGRSNNASPLHAAAEHGHLEVVQFLAEAGARVKGQTIFGGTPLHAAEENGHTEVEEFLRSFPTDEPDENPGGCNFMVALTLGLSVLFILFFAALTHWVMVLISMELSSDSRIPKHVTYLRGRSLESF